MFRYFSNQIQDAKGKSQLENRPTNIQMQMVQGCRGNTRTHTERVQCVQRPNQRNKVPDVLNNQHKKTEENSPSNQEDKRKNK